MAEDIRKVIEQVNLKYGEAIRKGDPAALAALYTEDACLLPPNSEMVRGRQAIQEFGGAMIQMGMKDIILTTVELLGSGDIIQEIGNYKQTMEPEGQEPSEDKGKYVVVWKRATEGWKLHWDIFNTNIPLQQ